jgi:succinate dehydrogenase/fumarate reductase flavoprotein subunit
VTPDGAAGEPTVDTADLIVIGAGAAGMTAALVASIEGLRVLVCEKAEQVGGTTATSAGTVWVPGSTQSHRAGVPDSLDRARLYLDSVIGTRADEHLRAVRDALLETGPRAIDYLERHSDVAFAAATAHPDYLSNHPGAAFGGRALNALPFDGRRLGKDFERIRPARPELMVLGGMMVAKADIPALVRPFASWTNAWHVLRLLARHARDRLSYRRGTRLVMGNALVARLFSSLRARSVPIVFGAGLIDLVVEDGCVAGAVLATGQGRRTVRATRGVVLATGGIGWNAALRRRLFPAQAQEHSLAPATSTGDGLSAAERAGGLLAPGPGTGGLWMPVSARTDAEGRLSLFPHIVLDRAKPGLLAVNRAGRRFVNEADSYHAFVEAMLADPNGSPAFLICDRSFIRDYGIGFIHPGTRRLRHHIRSGYLIEGADADALARAISVDADVFRRTIADYNHSAETGIDEAFGRGGTDLNRFNGDPDQAPNPCLRSIAHGPLYAVKVWTADLASSAGLRTDADARVLRPDGTPISGLYACGNDSVSVFAGTYPGPGTTLGPAIVFGWRAAMHASGQADASAQLPAA